MDNDLFNIADVHSLAGDGESLVDKATDWVSKGVPLAVASGVTSLANTAISLGNMFGDFEKIDFAKTVRNYDEDLGRYYEDHETGIDLGGFALTSLIPGTLGVKAFKALSTIRNGEGIATTTANIAGFFANKQEKYLEAAAKTISDPTYSLFGIINANKLKAIAAGFGEQAVEGAVFETSVLLTMNQNPVMEPGDRNYLQNIVYHLPQLLENAGVYGVVGGALSGVTTTGKIKQLILNQDAKDFPHITASQLGLNSLNVGAQATHAYSVLDDLKTTLEYMEAKLTNVPKDGEVQTIDQRAVNLQKKTVQIYEDEYKLFVTEKLFKKEDNDLAQSFLKNIDDLKLAKENGYDIPQTELFARIVGAAKKMERVGDVGQFSKMLEDIVQYHGSPQVVEGGFKNEERGSLYNLIGSGLYTTDSREIAGQYANRPGATKPTIYQFKEKPDSNIPLYDLNQPLTPELKEIIKNIKYDTDIINFPGYAGLDNAKTLLEVYTTAAEKSFGHGMASASSTSNAFQAIREHLESLGFRGLTHQGGILGGAKHKVKIYWNPENDLIQQVASAKDAVDGFATKFIPNQATRTVKLAGENKGAIVKDVYPVAGDLGQVAISKDGKVSLDGRPLNVPNTFDPKNNYPTESSNQFLVAHAKIFDPEATKLPISSHDIPAIEAAVMRGENPDILGYTGFQSNAADILKELKNDAIQELKLAGKGDDYISRALNVSRAYLAGDSSGAITLGSYSERALEDLTAPMHVKINYTGVREDAKFFADGMRRLTERVAISQVQRKNAATYIFGEDADYFVPPRGALPFTPSISAAAGFATSADGARNSTMLIAMQAGKMIDKLAKEQAARWGEKLAPHVAEISADPAQLYTRNLTATTIRASGEDMWRVPAELHPGGVEEDLILVPKSTLLAKAPKDADPLEFLQEQISALSKQQVVQVPINSTEAKFLIARQELTAEQAKKWNVAFAARGEQTTFDHLAFYEPPVDTTRRPFFALVQDKNPLTTARPSSYIFAQSEEQLKQKIAEVKTKFGDVINVYTKDDIATNKQLEGVFDSGLLYGKTAVDSALFKEGKFSEFIPRKDDYIFKEQEDWIWKQAQAIHRQGVELLYGSELAELRFLENNWNRDYSKFGEKAVETAKNPYTQVVNTFMNVSNKGAFAKNWGQFGDAAQSAWSAMTDSYANAWKSAQEGKLSYEDASKIAKQAGYSNAAESVTHEIFHETFKDRNSLSKLVSQVNLAVGMLMIRMDPLNSLINIMSLPVLLAAESSAAKKEILSKLPLSTAVPGTQYQIPTAMTLLMDGTRAFWNNEKIVINGQEITLKEWFNKIGATRTNLQQVQDSLAVPLDAAKSVNGALDYSKNLMKQIGEFGAKYSGNDLAEEFVRYQAAYAGLKFAQAQGISSTGELAAYVNMMVNRVHGNYLASQRPTIFSGPIGQAISLFQTYQFNMIQQMTRYLQEGNVKASTIALGMQNTIFGLQGNPLFWQLNQYIGNSNSKHNDLVTGVANTVGSGTPDIQTIGGHSLSTDPAKWLLYGLGANSLAVNLYNRGDLTPRYTTIVPTSIQDIPAVSIFSKAIGSFIDSVKAVSNGAPVSDAVLQGISHVGFNRPLAGLASLAAGGKTSNSGTLMTAYNDLDSFTVAAKLAGGEPLNNAIANDAYYRLQGYRTNQAKQMGELAEAVKLTTAGKPGELNPEQIQEFMQQYAQRGGDMQHFNKFLINATRNANQSIVNRMKDNVKNPLAQRQLSWLGADVPDYINKQ